MTKKMGGCNKKIENKMILYKCIRWIPFALFLIVLVGVFSYIKSNTLVVLEGEPKEIILNDFRGNIAMDTRMIYLDKGVLTNRDALTFSIDNNKYTAAPYEVVIKFGYENGNNKYGIKNAYCIATQNHNMYYSTTTNSEYVMSADLINVEKGDNTLEYFHHKINKASGMESESKITNINFVKPNAEGLLQIQNNEQIDISGDCTVYYKNKILGNNNISLEILNEKSGCSFEFVHLSNLEVLLNESEGIALNGKVNGMTGEFEVGDGRLLSTSPSSQRELYIGAQKIVINGSDLNVEYNFNTDLSKMVIKGKPDKAKLENIDLKEGWVQFFLANWAAIIMAFIGTIMSIGVGTIAIKKSDNIDT